MPRNVVKKRVNNIRYFINAVLVLGEPTRKTSVRTLTEAREVAKNLAIRRKIHGPFGKESYGWVDISKYNDATGVNIYLEKWKYDGRNGKFIHEPLVFHK